MAATDTDMIETITLCGHTERAGLPCPTSTEAPTPRPDMTDTNLLRTLDSRQLGLAVETGQLVGLVVEGGRRVGPTTRVHLPTLSELLEGLASRIETLVFVDDPGPGGTPLGDIEAMLGVIADTGADAVASCVAATEAVKRIDDQGLVIAGVDRAGLGAVRLPEVVDRRSLETAVDVNRGLEWANPTFLIASGGGRIRLYRPTSTSVDAIE